MHIMRFMFLIAFRALVALATAIALMSWSWRDGDLRRRWRSRQTPPRWDL